MKTKVTPVVAPPRRPRPTQSVQSRTESFVIAEEGDRVRLSRSREVRGKSNGFDFVVTITRYLDGGVRQVSDAGSFHMEGEQMEAVPARTKDVTDFGRLSVAAKTLARQMSRYSPEAPPSPEQVTTFVLGYRNLLDWRQAARDRMTQAEGEIDAVEAMLSRIM